MVRLGSKLVDALDAGIRKELLETAECVAVIAAVQKVAFVSVDIVDKASRLVAKMEARNPWTAAAMIGWRGGSFRWQLGGSSMEVRNPFQDAISVGHRVKDKLNLGDDLTASAGELQGHRLSRTETTPPSPS